MKHIFLLVIIALSTFSQVNAQKFFTRNGKVSFHSKALMENIDAYNNQGTLVLDTESNQIQMAVLIKAFQFEKALMQEHFNENYMESDQFPKAVFKGKIIEPESLDFSAVNNKFPCKIKGEITIRGISKPLLINAEFTTSDNGISASSSFKLMVSDYDIKIPAIVKDKIAREIDVQLNLVLEKMK